MDRYALDIEENGKPTERDAKASAFGAGGSLPLCGRPPNS